MIKNKSLVTGNFPMMILSLIENRDMYGYEIMDELNIRSNKSIELKAGTLYPLLHSLEGKGFISSYEKEYNGKMRKYYSITEEGIKEVKRQKTEWQEFSQAVQGILGANYV